MWVYNSGIQENNSLTPPKLTGIVPQKILDGSLVNKVCWNTVTDLCIRLSETHFDCVDGLI